MAVTPRYNDGAEPLTGQVNGERISAGRGVSIDSGALSGADIPMLDASGAVAMGRGGAAIGQGLASLGGEFLQLAEYQAKMVNSNRVNSARTMLDEERLALAAELEKEPDELKWGDLAEQRAEKARERLNSLEVSKAAKDEIDSIYDGWRVSLSGNTRVSSVRKTQSDFKANNAAGFRNAVDTGNLDQANAYAKSLFDAGTITEGEYKEMQTNAAQGVEVAMKKQTASKLDALKNQTIEMARYSKPEEVRAWIENDYGGHGLAPDEKQYLIGVAKQIDRDQTGQLVDTVTNQILSPGFEAGEGTTGIWTEAHLDAALDGSPFNTPVMKKHFMDVMEQRNRDIEQDRLKVYKEVRDGDQGIKNFYSSFHDATSWKPDMQSPEAAVQLATKIEWVRQNVRDDLQGEVTSILHQKFGMSGAKTPKSDDPPAKIITNRIATVFDLDMNKAKGALTLLTEKQGKGENDPQVIAARARVDDIVEQQARLKTSMDDYFQEHPTASRQDAVKYFNSQVSTEKAVQDADALFGGARGDTGPQGAAAAPGEDLISMVKDLEGWNANAYGDFKQTSIGYGTRGKPGEVISKEEGDKRLRSELDMHAKRIDEAAQKGGYKLSDAQRNALISFDFNTGKGAHLLETSGGDTKMIAERMSKYRIAGGKVNEGLVNRRRKERSLFESGL